MTRYHFLTKIGRGTYGAVFSGLDTAKTPPNPIVIKVMSMMNGSIPWYVQFLRHWFPPLAQSPNAFLHFKLQTTLRK